MVGWKMQAHLTQITNVVRAKAKKMVVAAMLPNTCQRSQNSARTINARATAHQEEVHSVFQSKASLTSCSETRDRALASLMVRGCRLFLHQCGVSVRHGNSGGLAWHGQGLNATCPATRIEGQVVRARSRPRANAE